MKKLLLLLTVLLAFTFTALAQDTAPAGGSMGQTTTTTKTKKTKKSEKSDQMGGMSEKGAKPAKEASLTGCISAQPGENGNYTLSNGRYKKGVEVGPADKVKDHAGHQVQLKGEWKAAGGEAGATNAAAKGKSFDVASVKHLSDTCSSAPGGGTMGETKKGEKSMKKGKAKGETPATPPPSL